MNKGRSLLYRAGNRRPTISERKGQILITTITIIQFYLCTCKFISPKVNYKVSTSNKKETTNTRKQNNNNNNNNNNNSIQFVYLCANLTAQRPITKLAQMDKIHKIIKNKIQNYDSLY
jgi:hypothetical protein